LENAPVSKQYNDLLVSQMSEPLDAQKNAELYRRVIAGDADARQAMIEGNMPLVIAKVGRFIRKFPQIGRLRNDLISGGFLGLANAVNRWAEGFEVKSPFLYLAKSIDTEIGKVMDSETPLRVPYTSKRRAQAAGEDTEVPTVINDIPDRFEVPSYESKFEMRDLVESCCNREEERTYVTMHEAGYTFAEIAAAINMPISSTYAMAKKLETRVRHKLGVIRDE
jgi:hypothetical protein